MAHVTEIFGSMTFNDEVMKQRLSKEVYKRLKHCTQNLQPIGVDIADSVANAMKNWAVEKGATHFTHWFQPMTGITAEKHDSFISPIANGKVIMEFSGKELVRGEPDASSFPSGGLRATFEARGYTAWDPTSYAFIKDDTLCIPTAFCSYSGEALDKKTPLLRSMEALDNQALRILKLFGTTNVNRVTTTVGPEQEYFLIDKKTYLQRPDLVACGRTLFGARPPKGQELDDHYFGSLKGRVSEFMKELDQELWKLGVYAKTKHNEVAPAQHELAPIFTSTNIATDHNQITMELMQKIANKHNMACLLHEKPFAGINGSGKHNNWSLSTDTGINLLEPGDTPHENAQFLLFLVAVIKAVDEHQDLLRISVANAGNDHRLGANEAPPAIISIFLGEELEAILKAIDNGDEYVGKERIHMEIGASVLPKFPKDTTDRNRTSPFAFTGNKFEFRMVGSTFSISGPNVILNTIVAESLSQFADELEKADDFNATLSDIIKQEIAEHKRIIFNGNNYADEWVAEAKARGLLNLRTTVDALPYYVKDENIDLFTKHGVLSRPEMLARYEIMLEEYAKTIRIEALTFIDMVKKGIVPSTISYEAEIAKVMRLKFKADISEKLEHRLLTKLSQLLDTLYDKLEVLEGSLLQEDSDNSLENAKFYREVVFSQMNELRAVVDELETLVADKYWEYPTYAEILYSVI
ncbi:MAG: glutamine synthetase III [Clostridiales bacterium]|jgi:glutamine synthetase|nr:glutamine synthetase III [Clostridiales bacterium]